MGVEIALEPTYPVLPSPGVSQFRIYNGLNCDYSIGIQNGIDNFDLNRGGFHFESIPIEGSSMTLTITATTQTQTSSCSGFTETRLLESGKANSFYLDSRGLNPFYDDPDKSRSGRPYIRVLTNYGDNRKVEIAGVQTEVFNSTDRVDVRKGSYHLWIDGTRVSEEYILETGGVYTVIVRGNGPYVRWRMLKLKFEIF